MHWRTAILMGFMWPSLLSAQCPCIDGIGSKAGDIPFAAISAPDGHGKIILCGYVEKNISQFSWKASEFEVIDCSTKKVMLTFGAVDSCLVTAEKEDEIVIEKMIFLPIGKDMTFKEVPLQRYDILLRANSSPEVKEAFIFVPPKYSVEQASTILRQYREAVRNRKPGDNLDSIIGTIALLAMSGSLEGQAAFEKAKEELRLDGCYGEYYSELQEIYQAHFKK